MTMTTVAPGELPLGRTGKPRPIKKSLADRLESSPGLYLLIFTLVYALAITANNSRREFWIDELFMTYLADLPSIGQIWPLIGKGIELNPPLPFWLTWMVHHSIGSGEIVSRLPSTIAFWVMCVCLFHFVRRRSDAVHGFIALLLPLFTFTLNYGTFARGYGLMLGFAGVALLSWQLAADGMWRPWTLAGLALAIGCGVSCHYYAAYIAVALGAGELVRTLDRKRIDVPVCVALVVGLSPLLAYVSLIRVARKGLATFWAAPTPDLLYQAYADLIGPVTIVLFVFVLIMLWKAPSGGSPPVASMPASLKRHETVVCALLLAMPLIVFGVSLVDMAAFSPRYVMPVVLGFAIAAAMFAFRMGGGNKWFRQTSISALVWLCLMPWCLWHCLKPLVLPPPGAHALDKVNLAVSPELPLVIDSDDDFISFYHYAVPSVRARLYTLADAAAAVRYRGSDTGMRSLVVGQTFRDLHVIDYRKFVTKHQQFLVLRTRSSSWIVQTLMADGALVELVDYRKAPATFAEESLMFRVRVPETLRIH